MGSERYLTPYQFLIWAMIALAVILSVLVFYQLKINIKQNEAEALNVKLANCLIKESNLVSNIENIDILNECKLNKELFEKPDGFFYFKILINDKEIIRKGNNAFEEECRLPGKEMPVCTKKIIYAYKDKVLAKIEILTGSNNKGER